MENITNNKPKTTGARIDKLLKEKGIPKKVFAIDMGVTPQAVSNWLKDNYTPDPEKLYKIAKYLDVNMSYLSCETDYKNINDMIDKQTDKISIEFTAINEFLASRGYYKGTIKAFYKYDTFGVPYGYEDIIKNDYLYDIPDSTAIFEIKTPSGEKKYIKRGDLIQLYNDFFTLLDTRLIDNIPE